MKKIFILFFALIGPYLFAQFSKTPTFLYMVVAKGDSIPSLLMGTIHHLGPNEIISNKEILSLIFNSSTIILEADTTELLHPIATNYDFNSKIPLDKLIDFAEYQIVQKEFLTYTGQDIEKYKYKMPLFIMEYIENGKRRKKPSVQKKPIMESAFFAVSKFKGIPIKGLETGQENYTLMYESMPLKDQAKLLMYTLKNPEFYSTESQMKNCWDQEDLSCMCSVDDMKHYTKPGDSTMIMKRNQFWLPRILNYLKQKKVFIAVGAAHLCGDYGIIALLKKKGYSVTPLTTKNKN